MEFWNTLMGRKFFNNDVPELLIEVRNLQTSINKLCEVLNPDSHEEIVPITELDECLSKGAYLKAEIMGGTHAVVERSNDNEEQ